MLDRAKWQWLSSATQKRSFHSRRNTLIRLRYLIQKGTPSPLQIKRLLQIDDRERSSGRNRCRYDASYTPRFKWPVFDRATFSFYLFPIMPPTATSSIIISL